MLPTTNLSKVRLVRFIMCCSLFPLTHMFMLQGGKQEGLIGEARGGGTQGGSVSVDSPSQQDLKQRLEVYEKKLSV